MTGSQHISRGLGCDDAFAYGHTGDFIVAAVADGAGSVSGTSAWGSYTACQAVLDLVMKPFFIEGFKTASTSDADEMMRWLFTRVRDRVEKQADGMGLPVGLLATTLSVAIAGRDLLVMGQIGDGIIASESNDRIATHLIEEKDEYANATWFIHSDEAFEKSFRTAAHAGATAFALSTDGMAYKITDIVTGEPFEPFFKGVWERVRSGAAASDFAALLRGIEDDQTGDDKTMVLAAMRWAADDYYPSARPVVRTEVNSPSPAPQPQPGPRSPAAPEGAAAPTEPVPPAREETTSPIPAAPVTGGDHPNLDALPARAPVDQVPGAEAAREKPRHRWRKRGGGAPAVADESNSVR
ncbi:protein phosphatase 2C domain-containing protein [Mycobacterium frederiksbergense]|uniref:PP2C family serine/threonine-protein phosphatase n=1 Tax=Mycolicibacterium frederiksbergense TaxID=117567 RepID=UPI0021F25A51|nr:PP2C family serine/threonine-protein phosphatase [Mycolicibacterium frederiksbergense]MCV7044739.1 protein phosphatase 2C domain-containing protein [Mycolicibacterium frederiksbergense]